MPFRPLCRTFFDYAARFALATLLAALTAGEQPAAPKQPTVTDGFTRPQLTKSASMACRREQ